MSNPLGRILDNLFGLGKAWWIEIKTESPSCTYFFGPFNEEVEAHTAQAGYIEDLELEGAQHIRTDIRRCARPEELTIEESEDYRGGFSSPAFSSQP
jgi:hypothetical protein